MRTKRDTSGWDPIKRTTIKARGHLIRFYEAGPMTAPRLFVAVKSKKFLPCGRHPWCEFCKILLSYAFGVKAAHCRSLERCLPILAKLA